jgi:hypothetical protein
MNEILKHSIRFVALFIIQAFILNQLEIGWGIQLMVYPLFIMLLPFDMGLIYLMLIAFGMGMLIDAISNTYGLHTSSLVLFAYLRPTIMKIFSPRDGYEKMREGNIFEMGTRWFVYVFGGLLAIHHFWFFLMEIFRLDELFFVLQKMILSLPLSYALCYLLQALFISKPKER